MALTHWRIRPAQPEDREYVVGLAHRLAEGFPLPAWRTAEEVERAEAATLAAALDQSADESPLLLAQGEDGALAGLVHVQRQMDYFRQRPYAHVAILAVDARAEGQGVGRALLGAAEEWARDQGLDLIALHVFSGNQRARTLYERAGYAPEIVRYVKPL